MRRDEFRNGLETCLFIYIAFVIVCLYIKILIQITIILFRIIKFIILKLKVLLLFLYNKFTCYFKRR